MTPRVSIIVPVYNGEAFVARAVRSALDQTEPAIEVLVADNGSTDGTWAVLEDLAAADRRVRPLKALSGRGADIARNACLDVARGEWVAVLDSDDRMHPHRLEKLLAFAAARGARVVADNLRIVDGNGRMLGLGWPPETLPASVDAAGFVDANHFGLRERTLGFVKPLVSRDAIESRRLRYQPIRVVEDYMFLYALLAGGEILHLCPEPYYDYVQLPGSLSRSFSRGDLAAVAAVTRDQLAAAAGNAVLTLALERRARSIELSLAHGAFVAAVKGGRLADAAATVAARPAVTRLIMRFGYDGMVKRLERLRRLLRPEEASPSPGLVAYFGQDCTDSAVIRRVAAIQASGLEVAGFTFRRRKFNHGYTPAWDNVDLGETRDRDYRGRVVRLAAACRRILASRGRLAAASAYYARNLDMAALACIARWLSGSRAPLVYEVLDVQRALLGTGTRAALLRWAERRVLARARMLVVSSPAFVERYFIPVQGFHGEWFLLENKILGPQLRAARVAAEPAAVVPAGVGRGRRVIGWYGTLRCVRSLDLLAGLAASLPDRLAVYLRGLPTETGLEPFLAVVRRHPNMVYGGEFLSPRDLPALYGGIDFAWCFDFLDAGANSDWLRPNRLYDAGYFNVPVLAAAGTETGRMVERLGLGWTFAPPYGPALDSFLRAVTADQVAARRTAIAALPRALFCEEDDTGRLMRAVFGSADYGRSAATASSRTRRDVA